MPASKFNDQTRRTLITAISLCAPRRTAAAKAGIDEKTLRNWLARGEVDEDGEPTYEGADAADFVEFRLAFLKAEAEAEHTMVGSVIKAAQNKWKPDWKAAAWLLERRHSDRWGYKSTVEHAGEIATRGIVVLPAEEPMDSPESNDEDEQD